MAISIHGPEDLGKYNSRPLITYEGNWGYCIYNILYLYLHCNNNILNNRRMKTINQISNLIILTLVNYARDYPWASYIANSLSQFDLILPELMQSKAKEISIYLNTDDCLMEFSSEIPDPEEIEPDFTFNIEYITFQVYFD